MLRTLTHYWRVHLAVVAGAAVATTVLAGALLVGDSVRGSLRELTLDRLGGIDSALVADRFLREELAGDLAAAPSLAAAAPAILLRGAAVHAEAGTRASRVSILGLDRRFAELFGHDGELRLDRGPGQVFPSVVINDVLARELGAEVGDAVILSFGRQSDVPRDTLMGDKDPDDVLGRMRLTVTQVLPDRGLGRFGLMPQQYNPHNAYVAIDQLQRALEQEGRVNALFVAHSTPDADPDARLAEIAGLAELGLRVRRGADHLDVESDEFVLRPHVDAAVRESAAEIGAPLLGVQSYLANTIRLGERVLPYSLVAALDPLPRAPWARLILAGGGPAAVPGPDGILLNTWAAADLGASVGDEIELTYYVVGPREELTVESSGFTVEGIARMEGLGADRALTPDYPGIQDAEDMSEWDPPFPVDLELVRDEDERFWDEHGATPKAFVAAETGRRLWSTRYGTTTSLRVGVVPGTELDATLEGLRAGMAERLSPASFGLEFRPVKEDGLRAAVGATDFSGLFIGFSLFLIVSAALLVALLFALGVEQRAGEIGLLLAVGHPLPKVRRGLLAEGGLLAVAGALVGLAGGVGYAWLMMTGLRTLWVDAVGSSQLYLHVKASSLAAGWAGAVLVVLLSIGLTLRRLKRVPPTALLGGSLRVGVRRRRRSRTRAVAWGSLIVAIGLVLWAAVTGDVDNPGIAFGAGTLLLISGLAFFATWCRAAGRGAGLSGRGSALVSMAARNSSWSPGRSVLSVSLVATACFMIVAVGSNRVGFGDELRERTSGAGGFALIAESDVSLHQNLGRSDDLFELGFSTEEAARLDEVEILPFRVLPGEDASCLNLYRPEKPSVLGVPRELIDRGGFDFQQHLELPEGVTNPWELLATPLAPGVIPAFADANSAMWILHLGLGDDVILEDELGEPVRLRLVGLLRGSVFQSELLVGADALLEHFPSRGGYGTFLVDAPWDGAAEVAELLESRLAAFGFDAVSTEERLASFKVVEHTYMSTFQLLGGLGLLLGTVGLAVVLVRNLIERRGELATLRAFGFRRASLAWMILAENGFLLLVGLSIGTVSALAAVAPRLATIHVPWLSLLMTLAAVALVGMAASLAAVRGALRIPLLPALKAER